MDLSADPSSCICPHCSGNDGSPCLLEAARRNLAAQKPPPPSSVDRLQLSQLGVTRRLLNPQLYELHDDVSEWTTADDDDRMATEDAAASVDGPTPETADSVPELNGQSASDQEEVWSDCTAELPPDDDRKAQIGRSSAAEIWSGCPAAKTVGGDGSGGSVGATTVESVEMDAECPVAAEEAVEPGSAASELPEPRTTCRATAATCCGGQDVVCRNHAAADCNDDRCIQNHQHRRRRRRRVCGSDDDDVRQVGQTSSLAVPCAARQADAAAASRQRPRREAAGAVQGSGGGGGSHWQAVAVVVSEQRGGRQAARRHGRPVQVVSVARRQRPV